MVRIGYIGLLLAFLVVQTLASYRQSSYPAVGKHGGKRYNGGKNGGIKTVKKYDEDERNKDGGNRDVDESYYEENEEKYGDGKKRNKEGRIGIGKERKVEQHLGISYKMFNKGGPFKKYYKPQYPMGPSYTGTGRRHKRSLGKLLWKLKQKFIAKKKKGGKSKKDNEKRSHPPAPKYQYH